MVSVIGVAGLPAGMLAGEKVAVAPGGRTLTPPGAAKATIANNNRSCACESHCPIIAVRQVS